MSEKYQIIELFLCSYFGVGQYDLGKVMGNKQNLYLTILLLDNFKCLNLDLLIKSKLESFTNRKIKNRLEKAREKILINARFREEYFQLEEILEKKLKKA